MQNHVNISKNADQTWQEACRLRRLHWGNQVFLRGIVEFSNYCRQNCLYCGLRCDNTRITRYRLDYETIYDCARRIHALGIGTVVLQSGEDPVCNHSDIARLIERIKTLGLAVTLSLGSRNYSEYRLWRDAGADRYLLKFETADKTLYADLRPGCTLDERLDCIQVLADMGYETGSGMIVGLPGEKTKNLEQDCRLLTMLNPDMVSVSPFVSHPDTPLGRYHGCTADRTLQVMATVRTLLPHAHMPVTSALGLCGDAVRLQALQVADVLMPSLTPEPVRESYGIYPGKNQHAGSPQARAAAMRDMLMCAGFELPSGPGGAWRLLKEQL